VPLVAAVEPSGSLEAAAVRVEFLGTAVEVRGTRALALPPDVFCRCDGHVHADATRWPHDLRCGPASGRLEMTGWPSALGERGAATYPMKGGSVALHGLPLWPVSRSSLRKDALRFILGNNRR